MLQAIHHDLSNYNRDDGAVVNDLMNGGNVDGAIARWIGDLSTFGQDALTLQDNPAPTCAGGGQLAHAAADWRAAATAYLAAARILASSPDLTGVNQSDPEVTVGNNALTRAQRALTRAVAKSHGLLKNIVKGTGTDS